MKKFGLFVMAAVMAMSCVAQGALYDEDFEGGLTDWGGTIVAGSGGNHYLEIDSGGDYSWLGGYRSTIGPAWKSSVDVYLDPTLATNGGYGFEFTQAITDITGNYYRQDNMFHVGSYDTGAGYALGVTVPHPHHSTSSEGNDPWYYVQAAYNNSGPLFTVESAGWYTFSWEFSPATDGTEWVYWSMQDAGGTEVFSYTGVSVLSASEMGGNSYMWFIGRGTDYQSLSIDNVLLTTPDAPVPEPTTLAIWGMLGGLGLVAARRRRRA
jgi:MYXO-CTERM domain-containing protein